MKTIETEALMERLRLKKNLRYWQYGALALFTLLAFSMLPSKSGAKYNSPHIARVTITGMITDNRAKQKLLKKLKDSKQVKAVIVKINSPGGTTTGGEMLYNSLRDISGEKPVVAVFGTVAASAGYMAGIAADHVVARSNTVTGSVGVIFQWADVSELLTKTGVTFHEVKSGILKATPSPFLKPNKGGMDVAQELVDDGFKWFVSLVEERRKIKIDDVSGLKQGRIFSGRQALAGKLIDQIGDEDTAIEWLEKNKNITKDIKLIDRKIKKKDKFSMLTLLRGAVQSATGLPIERYASLLSANQISDRLQMNGLVSLWSPGTQF